MGDGFGNLYDPEEGEPLRDLLGLHQSQKTARELKALRETQARDKAAERAKPQCPYCGGRLPGQFEICTHCKNPLSWVGNRQCKPGAEGETKKKLAAEHAARQGQQLREADARSVALKIAVAIMLVPAVLLMLFILIKGPREGMTWKSHFALWNLLIFLFELVIMLPIAWVTYKVVKGSKS